MKVQSSLRDDVAILNVSGELNADSVSKFNEAVIQAREHELRDFIVDVREVTAIDSAGLEALSALQRQCEEQLGMVRFCGADETLHKIFEITRLDKRFFTHDSIEEALTSFA